MLPADYYAVRVEEAHPPLIVMLVMTQLAVGACFVSEWLYAGTTTPFIEAVRSWQAGTALFFGLLALAASTLHLGRPHLAWRAVVGLRTSWLSREIVAFGAFAGAASAYAAGISFCPETTVLTSRLWTVALVSGLAGVLCSVMIYHCTRRPTWVGPRTLVRFLGTSLWLGLAATLFAAAIAAALRSDLSVGPVMSDFIARLGWLLIGCASIKLTYEALDFLHLLDRHHTPLKRAAALSTNELASLVLARFALGLLGGIVLPWSLLHEADPQGSAKWFATVTVLFLMSVGGELLERTLFFMTAVAPRMPGAIRT